MAAAETREGTDADPFRALAETTPDAIVTASAQDRIVYLNPAAERLLGYAADELIGQPVGTIVPEELRATHHAGLERYVRTREGRLVGSTVEVQVRRRDGTLVPVELSLGVAGDEEVTLTALIRDISERVRAERRAAAQMAVTSILSGPDAPDQRARAVAALTEALTWDVGILWLVEADALRAAELWQADEAATRRFATACRESAFAPGEGMVGRVYATAQPEWVRGHDDASELIRRDAALADGLTFAFGLPLVTEGEVVGVLELFGRTDPGLDDSLQDTLTTVASQIGENVRRQQHAADLARSNADLDQFASVVAHDLAEPLRTISGFAELLEARRSDLPAESAQFVQMILSSAHRGQDILDGVLGLARIGTVPIADEPVDLDDVVSEALVALQAMISETGTSVEVSPLPTVTGSAPLLGQVFQNLFANAMKFRGQQAPRIVVSAAHEAGHWRIDVTDNGRGIAPGSAVFEMFNRAGAPGEVGLGIGLAVCQKVVDRHHGTITFDSEPGRGTTFRLVLPATH